MSGAKVEPPFDVECPKCGAWIDEDCSPVTRLGFVHITGRAKPHVSRVRASKEKSDGK